MGKNFSKSITKKRSFKQKFRNYNEKKFRDKVEKRFEKVEKNFEQKFRKISLNEQLGKKNTTYEPVP